jgi:hypothetical protein
VPNTCVQLGEGVSSPDVIGVTDSLVASEDVMVIPGYLVNGVRPIMLAATKGWGGDAPQLFASTSGQRPGHDLPYEECCGWLPFQFAL